MMVFNVCCTGQQACLLLLYMLQFKHGKLNVFVLTYINQFIIICYFTVQGFDLIEVLRRCVYQLPFCSEDPFFLLNINLKRIFRISISLCVQMMIEPVQIRVCLHFILIK